jgi:cardiolipin synthase A/B
LLLAIAIAFHVAGIACALRALMLGRAPQGTVAWILSLILVPYLALPAYALFSHGKFRGYVIARRAREEELGALMRHGAEAIEKARATLDAEDSVPLEALERLAGFPFTRGNGAKLLVDGPQAFTDMLAGVRQATKYVLVQFYVVRDDRLGAAFRRILIDRVAAGVKVYVLYDDVGSEELSSRYVEALVAGGVSVSSFNGRKSWFIRNSRINYRNHRKIVVVDGESAWVGGLNIGDEYVNLDPALSPWRDTHVHVRGPSVLCCQMSFVEDWYWATGEKPELLWDVVPVQDEDRTVLAIPTGPADELETCSLAFTQMIALGRERVWIANPYFVPDPSTLSALILAAQRGADVRVLIPGRPDHYTTWLASLSFVPELVLGGVKVYLYESGILHQKVALIDDGLCTVGTANFDNRSFRINFEITLAFLDEGFAQEVAAMLERDFAGARAVSADVVHARPFPFRVAVQACRLLAPVL